MIHQKELVWAIHPDLPKPMRMTRGMLNKKRRLGWRELEGDYHVEENKEDFKKEVCEENKKERSDEYNRLISQGIIREFSNK